MTDPVSTFANRSSLSLVVSVLLALVYYSVSASSERRLAAGQMDRRGGPGIPCLAIVVFCRGGAA
jgi:hypothetical protein